MKRDWRQVAEEFDSFLRLNTFPVGMKLFESIEEARKVPRFRKPDFGPRLCQVLNLARRHGWTILVTVEILGTKICSAIIGLCEPPDYVADGRYYFQGGWFNTQEEAVKHSASMPRIPAGKYHAAVFAPLRANKFDPDLILVYGNPAQMVRVLTGLQWKNYERLTFHYTGESSCVDALGASFNENKVKLALPCFGERRHGAAQDDEMIIAIPVAYVDGILEGMRTTEKNGLRYPIPPSGAQLSVNSLLPKQYKELLGLPE